VSFKPVRLAAVALSLALGVVLGVFLQRSFGVGDALGAIFENLGSDSFWTSPPAPEGAIPEDFQGKLALFMLAGQSNMSGRGELPEPAQEIDPRIFIFGNDYRWRVAVEPVDDPSGQVDLVSYDPDAGFGPGVAFASALMAEHPGMAIGLIPCARGGSSIYQWRRSLGENTLYGSCLKRARAASTMGQVAGILFFQGEADAIDPEIYTESVVLPEEWDDWFIATVSGWREDLGRPELPVVYAQIGSNTAPEVFINWAVVKEQQSQVQLPSSAMIRTDDLALQDAVHFTSDSYVVIGQRFAQAFPGLTRY
jgi:hypothetical protein